MGLISQAVLALLTHPEQLTQLRADPSLARNAVDEVLRFEPPAISSTRSTPVDIEINGVTVPAGSNILVSILAGNRDPRRYDNPDEFVITREDIRPLTFGGGVHVCIGAALARMEAEVVLEQLIAQTERLELVTDPIRWQTENPTIRRPTEVVVSAQG
jgi:cytochrome P450